MLKRLSPLLLALSLLPLAASAHGPTRQKVTETVEINAPADKVWARIGNFGDMSWHPAIVKTTATAGNSIDSMRHLVLAGDGGPTIDEQLLKYDAAAMTYSYKITMVDVKVLPVNNYSSTITVTAGDAGKSKVEWRGAFYRGFPNNDPPPELNDDAAIAAVTKVYQAGLQGLKKALEGGK